MKLQVKLHCVDCGQYYSADEILYRCPSCRGLLEVQHDLKTLKDLDLKTLFDERWGCKKKPYSSGVWRYKELIFPVEESCIMTRNEGNTNLYTDGKYVQYAGLKNFLLKHEGENPTASFKDRGMTCGVTAAYYLGSQTVACASTGNTSASMASYAAVSGMKALIFIPDGKIAYGKLCQALAYNGKTIQIEGNFDDAMTMVQQVCDEYNIYLLNSINPFRIEGQKAIVFEILQQMDWEVPDWFVIPGGNLGNNTALTKGLRELYELGIINKVPRVAVIQAEKANPLYRMWKEKSGFAPHPDPDTIATAIKIGNPVSWKKSITGIEWCNGLVEQVSEQEIMDAKAIVDGSGIGAEPASCCSVAGAKKLREKGIIKKEDVVVGILTGHLLKDPNATIYYHLDELEDQGIHGKYRNPPQKVKCSLDEVKKILDRL